MRRDTDGALQLRVDGRPIHTFAIRKRWYHAEYTVKRIHREVTDPVGLAREESELAARNAEIARQHAEARRAYLQAEREREERGKADDKAAKDAWESSLRLLGLSHVTRWTTVDRYGVELSLSRLSRADALKLLAAGEAAGVFRAYRR